MLELPFLGSATPFPPVSTALDYPNGLLAYGGDLSVSRLLSAYAQGIFPWYSENEPILWWSPDPRAIIELDGFKASRSLRKLARQRRYRVTLNHAFTDVIQSCASIPRAMPDGEGVSHDTWITRDMQQAYIRLHDEGYAHSVEVWDQQTLVGGLYGVGIGRIFCGESMFHRQSNASKLALMALVEHMQRHDMAFIDCQMPTEHLASLGAKTIAKNDFLLRLDGNTATHSRNGDKLPAYADCWSAGDITP
ncbi:leucyl/phenylalanyl-tRNA--protein transferase [Alteromonas sp. CYL-A6]|uniref:leucyl/phenylalanyl-tRNA--protein transferase n=1 Tax=Alteromonas nitratireducens TaxID=3390813 RepID=UPI0039838C3D